MSMLARSLLTHFKFINYSLYFSLFAARICTERPMAVSLDALCQSLAGYGKNYRLAELVLIRRELALLSEQTPDHYQAPEPAEMPDLGRHRSNPWPIIEIMQAPALELIEAAGGLGLGLRDWIAGEPSLIPQARSLFPDYTPFQVGYVVLSAGWTIARAEFEVKAFAGYPADGLFPPKMATIDRVWPYGVNTARMHMLSLLRLEERGLDVYRDLQTAETPAPAM